MQTAKRKASKTKTALQLLKTPAAMLRWLRSKGPRSIVTRDTLCNETCLAANFLKAKGHTFDPCRHLRPNPWLCDALDTLPTGAPITAKAAIAALSLTQA